MEVLPFDAEIHREMLRTWLISHGLSALEADDLPRVGFLIEDAEGFLAAGFLREVEGRYMILDGLIANPKSHGKRRYYALDAVLKILIETAKNRGMKHLFATTKDNATLKRSVRHGFTPVLQKIIGMPL